MKTIIVSFFIIFITIKGKSQIASSASQRLCIEYAFSHIEDTLIPNKLKAGLYCLSLNGVNTSYVAAANKTLDSLTEKMLNNGSEFNSIDQELFTQSLKKTDLADAFFINLASKQVDYFLKWVTGDLVIKSPLPDFNWQLTDSSKDIIGVRCTKATGYWKGRHYTAWYAPSIPSSAGPWKANGLPGVILRLYDTKLHVQWNAISLYIPSVPADTKVPTKAQIVSAEQFEKMKQDFIKDPQGTMNSVNAANAANGNNSTTTITVKGDGKLRPKPRINNPIELP